MPDSMMGLFPGQSVQVQLHVSVEMTVVDTQGFSHPSHTDFFYPILVVAGDDAADYHGELQFPYFFGGAILVIVLVLAVAVYEKRKWHITLVNDVRIGLPLSPCRLKSASPFNAATSYATLTGQVIRIASSRILTASRIVRGNGSFLTLLIMVGTCWKS